MTLVFASKAQDLGELYEAYLKRQDTTLARMGYEMEQVKATPLIEFTILKKTPSDWRK
jgi:IS5 family transposase